MDRPRAGYGVPVKADPTAQAALLDLQATDSTLAQLNHRRKSLPEHAKIEELQARVAQLDGTRIEAATAVDDLTRDQRKADAEVELVKTRRARDEERLGFRRDHQPQGSRQPAARADRPRAPHHDA